MAQAEFAANLRALRGAVSLSQEQLARQVDVTVRSIVAWESGTTPSARHMLRLAVALGVPVEDLLAPLDEPETASV